MKTLDKYVLFSISFLIIFTIINMIIFCINNNEPTTLITCVYGTFGGEILTCALIKIFKLKRRECDG